MLGVEGVTRRYGDRTVLDDVTFEVAPGRLTGFVGANGAGKTTAMRIILGVLAPTSGSVCWDGSPITADVRRHIGYMPEERGLYPKMRVLEQLVFFAELHGVTRAAARQRATDLLERLDLAERAGDTLETLSLGNQQRVQIAAALVHPPVALVLDEPFSGLDPVAVDTMTQLLRDEMSVRVPVLFSSHQLDLVERLCDDLIILASGRVVASGPVDGLQNRETPRYRVVLGDGSDASWLRELDHLQVVDVRGPTALVGLGAHWTDTDLLSTLTERGPVREFARVRAPLSEIFNEVAR